MAKHKCAVYHHLASQDTRHKSLTPEHAQALEWDPSGVRKAFSGVLGLADPERDTAWSGPDSGSGLCQKCRPEPTAISVAVMLEILWVESRPGQDAPSPSLLSSPLLSSPLSSPVSPLLSP